MNRVCLLSGTPGTGKTTIIREAISRTRISAGGFYTEEIRSAGTRQGFQLITLDGQSCVLAHIDIPSRYQVGKYGVSLENFDQIGVRAVQEATRQKELVVIDEIGKMELFSSRFQEAVLEAINSDKRVLGAIMLKPHPFADRIKKHPQVKLLTVSKSNRERIGEEITRWLK